MGQSSRGGGPRLCRGGAFVIAKTGKMKNVRLNTFDAETGALATLWVANGSRITLRSSDGARQTMRASEEIITAPTRTSRSFGADGDDGKVDRDSVK